jgi:pimeloyl-ACP methyl ester carboxylesterase
MSDLKVSGIRRFLGAMLEPLRVASQAIGGNSPDQAQTQAKSRGTVMNARNDDSKKINGYAPVNGLKMFYEIEGTGDPLVFIPPAFGFAGRESFPELVQNHSVITVDLQGNGRTADIPERPISIEQYARDVVELLKYLKISKADFLGESYGGDTAAVIAVRYPEFVGRVVTYSATFAPPPDTLNPETTHYDQPPTAETRDIQFQREGYKKVAPDPNYWPKIYEKVGSIQWKGFSKEELASVRVDLPVDVYCKSLEAMSVSPALHRSAS